MRFQCLVECLRSPAMPLCYKRDVMLFINTMVNSSTCLEERMLIRADLLFAGMLEQIQTLKDAPLHEDQGSGMSDERYELEVQLQVRRLISNIGVGCVWRDDNLGKWGRMCVEG